MILQSYQVARMQSLKAANPNLKVLIYKDLSGMVERDQWGGVSTGVATQDAAAHPEWFLLNTSGQRFTFRYYSWIWAADIGNAAFQQKWADNVLAEIGTKGWDGVFMDDTNPSMDYHYNVASVAKYPTDAAYQAATGSALAAIGARFRAAGKLVVPNFGFWKDYPSVINGWLQHVDGGMNENFVKVGTTHGARGLRPRLRVGDAVAVDQGRRGAGQALPRRLALAQQRPRGRALRVRHHAARRRRQHALRVARRLHARELVRGVRLRARHARGGRDARRQRRAPPDLHQRSRARQPDHRGRERAVRRRLHRRRADRGDRDDPATTKRADTRQGR